MASTTFIDLSNLLLRRLNEVTMGQSDFAGARGVQAMAKDAINASIEQICQYEPQWPFAAVTTSQVLTQGTNDYSWPTDLKLVDWRSFIIAKDDALSVNSKTLLFISRDLWYKDFREDDLNAGTAGLTLPKYVFEKHGSGFSVTPSPDKAYTVKFDYWSSNTALVSYNDTSLIPTNFDDVIMQGALYHYYMFRDNTEQATQAEERFKLNLQHMRTLLINKENKVRTGMVNQPRLIGLYAENVY